MPMPMRGLSARLRFIDEAPSWAIYLPTELKEDLCGLSTGSDIFKAPAAPASQVVLAPWLSGSVWRLSQEPEGCWKVQQALDTATSVDERFAIAQELCGHMSKAARCPYANHVVQKIIRSIPPERLSFIVDEIVSKGPASLSEVARHKYGCRVIQRLLECVPWNQVSFLVDYLLRDTLEITRHQFGNYVMQILLKQASPKQRHRMMQTLMQHVSELVQDQYASGVTLKAISSTLLSGTSKDKQKLARDLLHAPGFLRQLGSLRQCHQIGKLMLQALSGPEQDEARRHIYSKGHL